MKVFIIGPIYPFRGGIAHSNLMLCKNLAINHQVKVGSFKRMFPKLLYPGKQQYEPNAKEKTFGFERNFLIDSINPLNWIFVAKNIAKEKPDRVIFQWWHTFFTPCYLTISFLLKKMVGKENFKIGVICQNVLPHEKSFINKLLTKIFFRQADYFVTLSNTDKKILCELMPKSQAEFVIEPAYNLNFKKINITKKEARKKLGIKANEKVLLFFGFVRPYKGLIYLIKAMPTILKKFSETKLLIVGEWWEDKEEYLKLIKKLDIEKQVKIVDSYIPNDKVPIYFKSAEAVVLPYTSSTESGIIQLAFEINTPIITTNVGGNIDLIEDGKTGLLVEPQNENVLAEKIIEFFEKKMNQKIEKEMKNKEHIFKWTKGKENSIVATNTG